MAAMLNQLTVDRIDYFKNQCHRFARLLSAEINMKSLDEIVQTLTDPKVLERPEPNLRDKTNEVPQET